MGVEYRHFIIPADQSLTAEKNIISEFDTLLDLWKLKAGEPKVIDLSNGEKKIFSHDLVAGHGLGIKYPEITGNIVAKVMGPSYYDDIGEEDRYIQSITLITGSDYRIHSSDEGLYIAVKKSPRENSKELEPYCEMDEYLNMHAEAYHGSFAAQPPEVKIESEGMRKYLTEQNFKGYWRTAISIDCGKDLPLVEPDFYTIPNKDFLNDLEKIFKCKLIQLGSID